VMRVLRLVAPKHGVMGAILLGAVVAAMARPCLALPLYASRGGVTCNTCHIDPNGGGIRNEFGFTFLKNRHSIEPEERWANLTVDPKLNEWITVGLDVRVLYLAEHVNGGETFGTSTFFPMQGQVNLAVQPHEHLTLVASHGLVVDEPGFPTGYVARELYGMIEELPGETYARVGRFRLPFGLRQDDHTSFTRDTDFLVYDSQKDAAGIEVGKIGVRTYGQLSAVNDDEPFVGRVERFAAKVGHVSKAFQVGLSGFHQDQQRADFWSLYASTTWRHHLTLIGEYAGGTNHEIAYPNREALFVELDYRAARGLNLMTKYDYADNVKDFAGGLKRRYTAEADINPVPFVETKLSYRYYEVEGSADYKDLIAMFYFPF
jgi:hypothetical protein